MNVITAIMVGGKANLLTFESFDTKQSALVRGLIDHCACAGVDEGRLVKVKLPEEDVVRQEMRVEV